MHKPMAHFQTICTQVVLSCSVSQHGKPSVLRGRSEKETQPRSPSLGSTWCSKMAAILEACHVCSLAIRLLPHSMQVWKAPSAVAATTRRASLHPRRCRAPSISLNLPKAWVVSLGSWPKGFPSFEVCQSFGVNEDFLQVSLPNISIAADPQCSGAGVHASLTGGKFCGCDKGKATNWKPALTEARRGTSGDVARRASPKIQGFGSVSSNEPLS